MRSAVGFHGFLQALGLEGHCLPFDLWPAGLSLLDEKEDIKPGMSLGASNEGVPVTWEQLHG